MTCPGARLTVLLLAVVLSCGDAPEGPVIDVWHGYEQRVGHLGDAQDDFNLMGSVSGDVASLTCSVNGGDSRPLTIAEGDFGFRRLAAAGHFNADIPIHDLRDGGNSVLLTATGTDGQSATASVSVERAAGASPVPYRIDWAETDSPQDAGQYVDGRWLPTAAGPRTQHPGYDRIFLIGERTWQDYTATAEVTIHRIACETSPISGGNGVGIIARFAGHAVGGHREFPDAQPKWGYQPFGAIGWLRWKKDQPDKPPQKQFYRGDNDKRSDHGAFPVTLGVRYMMKLSCRTLPDAASGAGVTRYSFKIWTAGDPEPAEWDWEVTQTSEHALRRGGVALLAHHIDATFGNVSVEPIR